MERRKKKDPNPPPPSVEHKGPLAACVTSTHPLKSRTDRTRTCTPTHARTPTRTYAHAGARHWLQMKRLGRHRSPQMCFQWRSGCGTRRKSDPTDSQTKPRSVVAAAHIKMNESLPLCWLLTRLSFSCNIRILQKAVKKILRFHLCIMEDRISM